MRRKELGAQGVAEVQGGPLEIEKRVTARKSRSSRSFIGEDHSMT
jgi:hypothetical protein